MALSRSTERVRAPLLPIEAQLFFLAIRPPIAGDDALIDRLLRQPINWTLFAALAERERMVSVLWHRLRTMAANIPIEIRNRLDRRATVIDFRMTVTSALLDDLVRRLVAVGHPPMLLKGSALARSVYPSLIDRPMTDLDLLLPRATARAAWSILRKDGWPVEHEEADAFCETHHHLPPLIDPRGANVVLELHHSMMPVPGPFALDDDRIWSEARPLASGALMPSPVHLLLHLCVHFAWSDWLSYGIARTVRDVAALANADLVPWDAFVDCAHEARASTCAYWTLALARSLAGAEIPDDALARLRPRQPIVVSRALERAYIATAVLRLSPSVVLSQRLWSAGVRPVGSGHGAHRPWDATARFNAAFQRTAVQPKMLIRLRAQATQAGAWLRFARLVGDGRPMVTDRK